MNITVKFSDLDSTAELIYSTVLNLLTLPEKTSMNGMNITVKFLDWDSTTDLIHLVAQ